ARGREDGSAASRPRQPSFPSSPEIRGRLRPCRTTSLSGLPSMDDLHSRILLSQGVHDSKPEPGQGGSVKELVISVSVLVIIAAIGSFAVSTALASEHDAARVRPSTAESVAARVDKLFAQWDRPDSPGCSLAVSRNGVVVYERGYGMANLELGV